MRRGVGRPANGDRRRDSCLHGESKGDRVAHPLRWHPERFRKRRHPAAEAALSPRPVCTVCTVEETACRRCDGEMAHQRKLQRNNLRHLHGKKGTVLLKHDRFSCLKHLVPGGCFQGKRHIKWCRLHYWQRQRRSVWTKQWKNWVALSLRDRGGEEKSAAEGRAK